MTPLQVIDAPAEWTFSLIDHVLKNADVKPETKKNTLPRGGKETVKNDGTRVIWRPAGDNWF